MNFKYALYIAKNILFWVLLIFLNKRLIYHDLFSNSIVLLELKKKKISIFKIL